MAYQGGWSQIEAWHGIAHCDADSTLKASLFGTVLHIYALQRSWSWLNYTYLGIVEALHSLGMGAKATVEAHNGG